MIQIYQHFFEELEVTNPKALNENFVIAYISSPYITSVKNLKNTYAIKIYFTHVSSSVVSSYVYAWDALSSVFFGHLFNINTGSNRTMPWENSIDKKVQHTKEFLIELENMKSFITLKDLYQKYGFYEKLFFDENNTQDIHKEFLTVYKTQNDEIIIIPCMVIVQAFYTKSPSNSLFDALTHPSGIKSMVKSCTHRGQWEGLDEYYMVLDGKSHMADKDMLFYFSRNQIHSEYFNDLGFQIQNKEKIKIGIPKEQGQLKVTAEYIRINPKIFYIRNILRSDLKDNDTDNCYFLFEHPKSRSKKKKFNNRDPNYDVVRENSQTDGVVNDNEIANVNDSAIIVSAEGINLDSTGETSYNSQQVKKGIEEDRGGRISIVHTGIIKQATFRDKGINSTESNAKAIEYKVEENKIPGIIEADENGWYDLVLWELKKYFIVNNKNYFMPINEDKQYASSFLDNEKKIKRKYAIIDVTGLIDGKQVSFLYVDIEPDKLNRRKATLILNKNSIIVEEKKLIQEILYAHLPNWGDDWKENVIIKQKKIEVMTHKHSNNIFSNIKTLMNKVFNDFI